MTRLFVLAVLLLTQAGCMRPFLDRADRIQAELERGNAMVYESTITLKKMEVELQKANDRLQSVDAFMKRFGKISTEEEQ